MMLMLYLAAGQAARSMVMLGRLDQHVRRSVNRDHDDHDKDLVLLLSEGSFESAQVRDMRAQSHSGLRTARFSVSYKTASCLDNRDGRLAT
jgi:hypothetical protein